MLFRLFPFLQWHQGYDTGKFRVDFVAGLTVALVLIPQSMAYAQLAGLPAYLRSVRFLPSTAWWPPFSVPAAAGDRAGCDRLPDDGRHPGTAGHRGQRSLHRLRHFF